MSLPIWNECKAMIGDIIAPNDATLKIVLKTKNDPYFLSQWIEHHRGIVNTQNLLVMDNNSDAVILDTYAKFPNLKVISYQGFHNNIHDQYFFPELYAALNRSSKFYLFLDTDEFLVYFDGTRFLFGDSVLLALASQKSSGFIPTTWLYNRKGKNNLFSIGPVEDVLDNGLLWGKPVVSASAGNLKGTINHNVQIAAAGCPCSAISGFYVLHMANLSPEQRIATNREKLIARGFISSNFSDEQIADIPTQGATSNEKMYVEEIRRLVQERSPKSRTENQHQDTSAGQIGSVLIEDSTIPKFYDAESERIFLMFNQNFESVCSSRFAKEPLNFS